MAGSASSSDDAAPLVLPPASTPNRRLQAAEERRGIALVGFLGCFFVGLATAVALSRHSFSWAFAAASYVEVVLAVFFLMRVLYSNAGVIARSSERCYPVPCEVARRIQAGESLQGLVNPRDGSRSYCVRCCVWRPPNAHHCSTCQRCTMEFDHHCNVLGRCIGGSTVGFRGNMPYFHGLILMAPLNVITASLNIALSFPPHGWWALLILAWFGIGLLLQASVWCGRILSRRRRVRACCSSSAGRECAPAASDFTLADAQRTFGLMENRFLPVARGIPVLPVAHAVQPTLPLSPAEEDKERRRTHDAADSSNPATGSELA